MLKGLDSAPLPGWLFLLLCAPFLGCVGRVYLFLTDPSSLGGGRGIGFTAARAARLFSSGAAFIWDYSKSRGLRVSCPLSLSLSFHPFVPSFFLRTCFVEEFYAALCKLLFRERQRERAARERERERE